MQLQCIFKIKIDNFVYMRKKTRETSVEVSRLHTTDFYLYTTESMCSTMLT